MSIKTIMFYLDNNSKDIVGVNAETYKTEFKILSATTDNDFFKFTEDRFLVPFIQQKAIERVFQENDEQLVQMKVSVLALSVVIGRKDQNDVFVNITFRYES